MRVPRVRRAHTVLRDCILVSDDADPPERECLDQGRDKLIAGDGLECIGGLRWKDLGELVPTSSPTALPTTKAMASASVSRTTFVVPVRRSALCSVGFFDLHTFAHRTPQQSPQKVPAAAERFRTIFSRKPLQNKNLLAHQEVQVSTRKFGFDGYWLPPRDSNPDWTSQSRQSYH